MRKLLLHQLLVLSVTACGVRGDPMPPGTPAELGRGKPNYRRATEDLAFPVATPQPQGTGEEDDGSDVE